MDLFKNTFVQAVGVAALAYLVLQAFGWGLESVLSLLESFARWYRFSGSRWLEEIALAAGALYLLFAAVINSK
ncbi:MAG: hypothetical protein Tsb0014_41220 [Pleurocapsa sp.]